MQISELEIRRMAKGLPVGNLYPYSSGATSKVEQYLRDVVGQIKINRELTVEPEFDHFQSGYASFVDVFVYPSNGSTQKEEAGYWITDGISFYLSRVAPYSVYGINRKDRRISDTDKTGRIGSYGFLMNTEEIYNVEDNQLVEVRDKILKSLEGAGFSFPDKEVFSRPIGDGIDIPTIFSDAPFKLFDAIFYWED